jgi:hypothetical protein
LNDSTDHPAPYTPDEFLQDIANLLVSKGQTVSISNGTMPEITALCQRLLDLIVNPLPSVPEPLPHFEEGDDA